MRFNEWNINTCTLYMYYTIRNVRVMAVCHVCHVMSNVHVNGIQSCIINVQYILSSLYKQQLI